MDKGRKLKSWEDVGEIIEGICGRDEAWKTWRMKESRPGSR